MRLEVTVLGEGFGANITLEALGITVNSRHMLVQIAFLRKLLAANVTLVTPFSAWSCSVCRVVVSAEGRVVTEHHVTDLTLNTRLPCLWNTQKNHCQQKVQHIK